MQPSAIPLNAHEKIFMRAAAWSAIGQKQSVSRHFGAPIRDRDAKRLGRNDSDLGTADFAMIRAPVC
jgi:hypothetical protein